MHKSKSTQENEMRKIFRDFHIQTDHLIPARRPYIELINEKKRTRYLVYFAVSMAHRVEMKKKRKDRQMDFARELKKTKTVERKEELRRCSNSRTRGIPKRAKENLFG